MSALPRAKGRPEYFSDMVVAKDSGIKCAEHLRGSTLAYNDVDSLSGYHCVRSWLERNGEDATFFGGAIASAGHARSVELVLRGDADCAAIDMNVMDQLQRTHPHLVARLRVLEDVSMGPNPAQPMVASTTMPAGTLDRLRRAVTSLHELAASGPGGGGGGSPSTVSAGGGGGGRGRGCAPHDGGTDTDLEPPTVESDALTTLAGAALDAAKAARFVLGDDALYVPVRELMHRAAHIDLSALPAPARATAALGIVRGSTAAQHSAAATSGSGASTPCCSVDPSAFDHLAAPRASAPTSEEGSCSTRACASTARS